MPSLVKASLWQTPQACTLIRTWPGPGSGMSRSTSSKRPVRLGDLDDPHARHRVLLAIMFRDR